jgi:hypothetical protein
MLPPHCLPLTRCCRAASATLPTLPPRCQRCRCAFAAVAVLPPPPLLCHRCAAAQSPCIHAAHQRLAATANVIAATALLPLPLCWQRLCCATRRRRATAALPPPICQRYHHAPATNPALQMPSPRCLLLLCWCRATSPEAAIALQMPPPCYQGPRHAAAAATTLPRPAAPLPTAAELPPLLLLPLMHCRRLPLAPMLPPCCWPLPPMLLKLVER